MVQPPYVPYDLVALYFCKILEVGELSVVQVLSEHVLRGSPDLTGMTRTIHRCLAVQVFYPGVYAVPKRPKPSPNPSPNRAGVHRHIHGVVARVGTEGGECGCIGSRDARQVGGTVLNIRHPAPHRLI